MKKGLLIIMLLLISGGAYAQLNKFEIGVEGGPDLSGIADPGQPDQNDNQNWVLHFSVGMTGQYNFDSILSIKGGISFERKGYSTGTIMLDGSGANPSSDYFPVAVKLDYLVIPVFIKALLGGKVKFFVNGGPYYAQLIGAFNIMQSNGLSLPNSYLISTNSYNHIDAGLAGGFGWDIQLNKRLTLDCELRFSFSLLNNGSPFRTEVTENQSANLLFGLRYKIKK